MISDDDADFWLLMLANEKRKFAIQIGYTLKPEQQAAFERGIDNHWFDLVDVSPVSEAPASMIMRIFRLTEAGIARLEELVCNNRGE